MTSVVIVGSGFTGFECARHLARKVRRHQKNTASVDISIISPVDYMLYTPLLPDVAGGVVDARFVALRALADSAAKQMNFDPAAVKFVLLDLAEQVMPEVGEKLGAAAMRVLKARGIDVRLGVTLKAVPNTLC